MDSPNRPINTKCLRPTTRRTAALIHRFPIVGIGKAFFAHQILVNALRAEPDLTLAMITRDLASRQGFSFSC